MATIRASTMIPADTTNPPGEPGGQSVIVDPDLRRLGLGRAEGQRVAGLAAAAAQIAVRTALETFKRTGGTTMSVAEDADKAFSLLEESINYPAAPASS